jgi:RNA polymerase sigma-32 factor
MNRRIAGPDNSLNAPLREEGDGEWQDWLVDDTTDQEQRLAENQELTNRRHLLGSALGGLKEREREIFFERRLKDDPSTLDLLSRRYGISRERVRQIEVRAFEKVQKAVRNAALDQAIAA